jgi:hypothetical protein
VQADPREGQKIIDLKKSKFIETAARIAAEDPDAYEYLTGRRSDSRVGYSLLAGLGALCAIPFLLMAGLLILGALVIVRFGVMLFPAFATLGMFPTMRSLVTGIGSTMASALINALIFGIGAAATILGMSILLSPSINAAAWLQIVLMLLLTIVMWVALSPFRRLTQMVSNRNHFAAAASGTSTAGRGAARASSRILSGALGTFLGVSAAQRSADEQQQAQPRPAGVPQRAEANTSYTPIATDELVGAGPKLDEAAPGPGAVSRPLRIDSPSVTVIGAPNRRLSPDREDFDPEEIYSPAARTRSEMHRAASPAQPPGAGSTAGMTAGMTARTTAGMTAAGTASLRPGSGWMDEARTADASADRGQARGARRDLAGQFESGPQRDESIDAVRIGRPARERPLQDRTEAETARDRFRDELDHAQHVEFDEISEVFRPSSPANQASPTGSQRT